MDGVVKLLIVDFDDERRARLAETVKQDPSIRAIVVKDTFGVHGFVRDFEPDMVIVASQSPARDAIDDLRTVGAATNGHGGRPVALLVDRLSPAEVEEALRAGVAAYVADNLDIDRIRSVIAMATAQFRVFGEMRRDLDRAKTELADRKDIERAKGLVMKRRNLDEDAAYKLLRATAMNQGRPIAAIARDLLSADSLLGGTNT
jgi:two-component system, response regulator / RNA-binding antiterminator